jgi:hypothetical protein
MWIKVAIVNKEDEKEELEPIRINLNRVVDYRKWRSDSKEELTVFYFDKTAGKNKTIARISVEEVDAITGASGKN